VLQYIPVCCSVLQCVKKLFVQDIPRFLVQCVAVCCSVLQCVAACCSVLQCAVVCEVPLHTGHLVLSCAHSATLVVLPHTNKQEHATSKKREGGGA